MSVAISTSFVDDEKNKDKREKVHVLVMMMLTVILSSTKYPKRFEGFQRFSDFFSLSSQFVGGWETPFFGSTW